MPTYSIFRASVYEESTSMCIYIPSQGLPVRSVEYSNNTISVLYPMSYEIYSRLLGE